MTKDEIRDRLMGLVEESTELYPSEINAIVDVLLAHGVTFAEDKWIPVSERLPENDTTVLVYRPSMTKQVRISYYFNGFHEGQFDIHGNEVITHWMPLPEVPKGVDQMIVERNPTVKEPVDLNDEAAELYNEGVKEE